MLVGSEIVFSSLGKVVWTHRRLLAGRSVVYVPSFFVMLITLFCLSHTYSLFLAGNIRSYTYFIFEEMNEGRHVALLRWWYRL